MTTDKDRVEFEAAIADQAFGSSFKRRTDGEYLYSSTEFAWQAWQAARSRSGAVPAMTDERATFERWATGETIDVSRGPKTYKFPSARFAWAAWQARASAAPEPPQGDIVSSEEGYRAYSLLARAIDAMEALHSEIEPDEECENGIVPAATMRKFVDAHAELLHERERLAFSSICPDCAARVASADTPRSGDAPVAWPGLSDLECAISQLRETGYYFDEEGEATNELAELLAALKCVAPPANAPTSPAGLHPRTADLVRRFSVAMAEKLFAAQEKYGYRDGWADPSWIDECREHLLQHVEKGDPRDVANYCAFLWHHGEDTKSALARVRARHNEILDRFVAGITQIGVALGAGEQQARDEFPDGLLQRVAKLKVDAPADARDAEDARRYRWLRHCNIEQDRSVHGPDYTELLDGERLDAAIDSAMGAGGGK